MHVTPCGCTLVRDCAHARRLRHDIDHYRGRNWRMECQSMSEWINHRRAARALVDMSPIAHETTVPQDCATNQRRCVAQTGGSR